MTQQDTAQPQGPKGREMKKPLEESLKSAKLKVKQAYDTVTWVKADLFAKFWDIKQFL